MTRACTVCGALPPDGTAAIRYPPPAAADEWAHDDRIRGVLLGAAIGDALGAVSHGGRPVPELPRPGSVVTGGATQLGLFTAEGLVRMLARFHAKGIGPAWDAIRHGLHRWMVTQGRTPPRTFADTPGAWPDGWLVRQHALHRRVEGFGATVSALASEADVVGEVLEDRRPRTPVNASTGAGALVRVVAAGAVVEPAWALRFGVVAALYTHGGPDGYLAAGALSRIVAELIAGADLRQASIATADELAGWPEGENARAAVTLGGEVGATHAARALATGLRAVAEGDDPVAAIERVVELGGTAAGVVAGAVAGARDGASAFLSPWRVAPDLIGPIEELGDALGVVHRGWVMGRPVGSPGEEAQDDDAPISTLLWSRFPGW